MKKLLLTLLTLLSVSLAKAAPAYPFPITVTQPDGTQLTILLHGDEHFHWTTTTDGVLLAGKGSAYYVAQVSADGQLSATTLLAHEAEQRTTLEAAAVSSQMERHALFFERSAVAPRRVPSISSGEKYFPHSGTPRVLIILAAYQDKAFTVANPVMSFEQYFNSEAEQVTYSNNEGRNYCSVAQYFKLSSGGQFTPQFDIVGPVTLPHDMAYYGGSTAGGSDEKFVQLCTDACEQVKEQVDFSLYDNDGDGVAELIYVLHAGLGENTGGPAESMWAKCGSLGITVNGTKITFGGCHSELFRGTTINGIGVFCHEFSHGMGLPDLYPTVSGAARNSANQSMQSWDIMDYGLYNENVVTDDAGATHRYSSYAPAAYTAWEREVMGWTTIQPLSPATSAYSLTPLLDGGTAYKIQNPKKENEYIVLENIQQQGLNNGARGHGLLAYHVDYANSTVKMGDSPNNTAGHPRVAVIPSGGIAISTYITYKSTEQPSSTKPYSEAEWKASHAATPFPGTAGILRLTDEQQLPNFNFYNTEANDGLVGHGLFNITEEADGTVTFGYDLRKWESDLSPIAEETNVTFSEGDLEDTVIDNIYYNLPGTNGYDSTEGCIVINDSPSMNTSLDTGSNWLDFIGLIFQVDGKGIIELDCQTVGGRLCGVRFGEAEPQLYTKEERGTVEVAYDATEPTLVYVYTHNDIVTRAPRLAEAQADCLKLWGLNIKPGATTGIERPTPSPNMNGAEWYDLQGRKLKGQPAAKGIYIHNGRKVTVK